MSRPLAIVKSLDHLVLTCANTALTAQWYTEHLGMKLETFTPASDPLATPRMALKYGSQKINLHQKGAEFEPKAATALPGTADLCFLVGQDTNLDEVIQGFQDRGITVLEGGKTVARTGAQGPIQSIYVRDPDGNLIDTLTEEVSGSWEDTRGF
ncbi:unnamed protein product [Clonostachys rosea f. rosea IK726]|uniref:VOC domain-containing protein n=2 Tax=Bionectria ochroleuca TaxID=29856 RepID=A0A0B7JZF3_BIOOC|nr:unnamed protein product [Clonostachys rosea f. rosea IK726]